MIVCTEKCKYQKNGECTYEEVKGFTVNNDSSSSCAYFEQE